MRQLKRMNRRQIAAMMQSPPKEQPQSDSAKDLWKQAFRPTLQAGKSVLDNKDFMHTTAQKQKLELAVQNFRETIGQIEDTINTELPDEKQEVQTGLDMHGKPVVTAVGVEEFHNLSLSPT